MPDDLELASSNSLPADPDTDGDLLLDGAEDINGNGLVEGGESDPSQYTITQTPTDIRTYQCDGIRDYASVLWAENGMHLYGAFDGRYLYVAIEDAGEGSDHFVFVVSDPNDAVAMPWAKTGQVARWDAYLADENDNDFRGWFDAGGAQITNLSMARAATYFENGGVLEGILDLSQIYSPGFTQTFYLAAAPYGSADGGALYPGAQVPAGNGDGDILGSSEYIAMIPGDLDGDGISDYADPDHDGDGLPDDWEELHGLDPESAVGANGAEGDPDTDGARNYDEYIACTDPADSGSIIQLLSISNMGQTIVMRWPAVHGKSYILAQATGSLHSASAWSGIHTNDDNTVFPLATNTYSASAETEGEAHFRLNIIE